MSKPLNSFGNDETPDIHGELDSYEMYGKEIDGMLDDYPEMTIDNDGYIEDFYYE